MNSQRLASLYVAALLVGACRPARALSEVALVANTPAAREALLAVGTDGYLVQALPALVKARPEQLAPGSPAVSLALHAARGEAESGQVLVTPLREGLRQVNARVQLRGPDGAALAAELRLLGTVPVAHPTAVSFGVAGDYPDPLKPLRPFDVEVGTSQSLWLTVRVPADAVPGEYTGAVTVAPSGREPVALPLTITVYPVDLPALSFLKTVILLYEDYDLLTLLERRVVAIRSDPARLARCEPARLEAALAALATYPLVRAVDDFEKDAAAYDGAHLAVLRALAGLGR
jgi:hypothetical protein